jgi:hypothetical protein
MDAKNSVENPKYSIVNIRRGKGARAKYIYANIVDQNGQLFVSATLEYCYEWVMNQI